MVFNVFSSIKEDRLTMFVSEMQKIQTTRVFDWTMAKKIIDFFDIDVAYAGIREDWASTSDIIYKNGKLNKECSAHLASRWGSPILRDERGYEYDCFKILFEECEKLGGKNSSMDNKKR